MSRTKYVARMAWSVFFAVPLVSSGCSCSNAHERDADAGPPIEPDAGLADVVDVGRVEFGDGDVCTGSGLAGAHCRSGSSATCQGGTQCIDLSAMSGDVQTAFGLRQGGADDPAHPGYPLPRDPADPLASAPFNAAEGTLCAQQCDAAAAPGTAGACGTCTTCSTTLTQMPLIAAFGGVRAILGGTATFGPGTGLCRLDCTWDPSTSGAECPSEMTCDAFGSVCIEACTTDNECNTNYGVTYAGETVTVLDAVHPLRCNAATGRCESAGHTGAAVGDPCASADDCAPGTGVCLAGGRCAEFGCTNPNTATSVCAAAHGICLTTNASEHPQSLCLLGCNTAADCGAGNSCNTLWADAAMTMPFPIGPFTGYCIGFCDSDEQCIATEACTDTTTADGTRVPGQCVPRCTGVGAVGAASGGCMATEMCFADHAGASYGHCAPVDHFCGIPDTRSPAAADPECAVGWVCDELLAGVAAQHERVGDGHCTPACATDAECPSGTCVTTGPLAGLCRHACATDADCAAPTVCDATAGWCVEAAPPPP